VKLDSDSSPLLFECEYGTQITDVLNWGLINANNPSTNILTACYLEMPVNLEDQPQMQNFDTEKMKE